MWGGCSVDTDYGMNLSRRFVNGRHNTHDAIYLMNKHNNKAGRQVGGLEHNLNDIIAFLIT